MFERSVVKEPPECLALLVGSNPLPNYLATLLLKPRSVLLFFTPQTKTVKENLRSVLKEKFAYISVEEIHINDGVRVDNVQKALPCLDKADHLNYTGGTKVMAAYSRLKFRELGRSESQASYLDDRERILLFDDGNSENLSNCDWTFEEIMKLHGVTNITKINNNTIEIDPEPVIEDAHKVALRVFESPKLAKDLYNIHKCSKEKRCPVRTAKENPIDLQEKFSLSLQISSIPGKEWTAKTYKRWCKFLGGEWLEEWTGHLIKSILPSDQNNLFVGVDCERQKDRQFEVDVAFVHGHRFYLVSCTTATEIGMCKSKLFEVAVRAKQLGGDLARSALVCLLHGRDTRGLFVDQLRDDIQDIWGATNTTEVFGLDDLKSWVGTNGNEPDTTALCKWIDI